LKDLKNRSITVSTDINKNPFAHEIQFVPAAFYLCFYGLQKGVFACSSYYSFCDTVPTQLPYLDASGCSFVSTKNDDFPIQFNNVRPTYYRTDRVAGKITYKLFASPDATSQHPLSFLLQQKSILLKNQDLSGLKLQNFNYEKVDGFDYAGYFNYVFNPELLKNKLVRSSAGYGKAFP
jgi:hypothetical protein